MSDRRHYGPRCTYIHRVKFNDAKFAASYYKTSTKFENIIADRDVTLYDQPVLARPRRGGPNTSSNDLGSISLLMNSTTTNQPPNTLFHRIAS